MQVVKYQKTYVVRSYEADCHGVLRLLSLMNILQDIATENADALGLGFVECQKLNLAWVGSNYLLHIERMPKINETFTVTSWPAEAKLWGAVRDFVVTDANGEIIIKASSQWVLIDYVRRRPVMLKKYFPDYVALNERALATDFAKMPEIIGEGELHSYKVRFDDIDVNQHVNNAVYPLWASESVHHDYRMTHIPQELEITFKKEALYGETVEVLTQHEGDESRHSIRDKTTQEELALCRIKWRRVTSGSAAEERV